MKLMMGTIEILKKIILLLLFITINTCNTKNKETVERHTIQNRSDLPDFIEETGTEGGIVYFSIDSGRTWMNASKGLPGEISIGLGGVATSSNLLGLASKEKGVYLFDGEENIWVVVAENQQMVKSNIGAMIFYNNDIYVGSQHGGVFYSNDKGKSWTIRNNGLGNLTVRRFAEVNDELYVGTNNGLYTYDSMLQKWELVYGQSSMQVNGISGMGGTLYIATNQGAYKFKMNSKNWEKISDLSFHNISLVDKTVYAMTYNELLSSVDEGKSWTSIQDGLPRELYTFNVIEIDDTVFAGQWDGIYKKAGLDEDWIFSSQGLPAKFATTNLVVYQGVLIITASERGLRTGGTIRR